MEKGQESQNFDCDVKPETEVERMERHTDQGEMERRTDWQWRGDPGHCQGLGRRKVREAWVLQRLCKDGAGSLPW